MGRNRVDEWTPARKRATQAARTAAAPSGGDDDSDFHTPGRPSAGSADSKTPAQSASSSAAAPAVKGWRDIDASTWVVLANVVLYALAFQMQTPLQPYIVASLQSEDAKVAFAQLRTVNAFFQLLGSLASGVLIDRLGAKPVLVLSVVASAASYGLTATADTFTGLAAAQVPTLLQHLMLGARAFVTIAPSTDAAFKTVLLGYIGVAYGVGFVIGPSLGGWLAKVVSLRFAAWVALVLSVASALWLQLALPGGTPPAASSQASASSTAAANTDTDDASAKAAASRGWLARLGDGPRAILATPSLRSLFGDKLVFSFALAVFHAVFSLIAKDRFGLDSQAVGFLMSAVGVVGIAAQASVQALLARASEAAVAAWSAAALSLSFVGLSFASTATQLALVSVPISVFGTVFSLITTSQISRAAPAAVKGSLVAADMAVFSGVRLVTPAVGTFLFVSCGYWSLGAATGLPVAGIALKLLLGLRKRS